MTIRTVITRSAELESLPFFRQLIDQACDRVPAIDQQTRYDLKLAVDEACTNIILYGYKDMDPGSIILNVEIDEDAARVTVTDFGRPFEPVEVELPDLEAEAGAGQDELGLFFIHQSTDRMDYETSLGGNSLRLIKYLKPRD
jgi:serine/threonine-protein kinase RsbW